MSKHIIIVGAGIAGLTLGILLKQQGFNVTILEKRSQVLPIGGGLGILPIGTEVLMSLPCADEIKKLAENIKLDKWGDAEGHTLRQVNTADILQINGHPSMVVCRSELHQILLKTFGLNNMMFGTEVTSFTQNDQDVIIHLSNGDSIKADILIGADGTFSSVRKLLFPSSQLTYTGYISLVGIGRFLDDEKPKHNFIVGQNRFFITFPISDNRQIVYTICPFPYGELKKNYSTPEKQFPLYMGWSDEVDKALCALKRNLQNPEFELHFYCTENLDMPSLPALNKKNVVLIGDAAHPLGSIMGLNTNIALKDAQLLTQKLKLEANTQMALEQFSREAILNHANLRAIEEERKEFFVSATEQKYLQFLDFVTFADAKKFSAPLFNALKKYYYPHVVESKHSPKFFNLNIQNDDKIVSNKFDPHIAKL